jgi:hypothetical protein
MKVKKIIASFNTFGYMLEFKIEFGKSSKFLKLKKKWELKNSNNIFFFSNLKFFGHLVRLARPPAGRRGGGWSSLIGAPLKISTFGSPQLSLFSPFVSY